MQPRAESLRSIFALLVGDSARLTADRFVVGLRKNPDVCLGLGLPDNMTTSQAAKSLFEGATVSPHLPTGAGICEAEFIRFYLASDHKSAPQPASGCPSLHRASASSSPDFSDATNTWFCSETVPDFGTCEPLVPPQSQIDGDDHRFVAAVCPARSASPAATHLHDHADKRAVWEQIEESMTRKSPALSQPNSVSVSASPNEAETTSHTTSMKSDSELVTADPAGNLCASMIQLSAACRTLAAGLPLSQNTNGLQSAPNADQTVSLIARRHSINGEFGVKRTLPNPSSPSISPATLSSTYQSFHPGRQHIGRRHSSGDLHRPLPRSASPGAHGWMHGRSNGTVYPPSLPAAPQLLPRAAGRAASCESKGPPPEMPQAHKSTHSTVTQAWNGRTSSGASSSGSVCTPPLLLEAVRPVAELLEFNSQPRLHVPRSTQDTTSPLPERSQSNVPLEDDHRDCFGQVHAANEAQGSPNSQPSKLDLYLCSKLVEQQMQEDTAAQSEGLFPLTEIMRRSSSSNPGTVEKVDALISSVQTSEKIGEKLWQDDQGLSGHVADMKSGKDVVELSPAANEQGPSSFEPAAKLVNARLDAEHTALEFKAEISATETQGDTLDMNADNSETIPHQRSAGLDSSGSMLMLDDLLNRSIDLIESQAATAWMDASSVLECDDLAASESTLANLQRLHSREFRKALRTGGPNAPEIEIGSTLPPPCQISQQASLGSASLSANNILRIHGQDVQCSPLLATDIGPILDCQQSSTVEPNVDPNLENLQWTALEFAIATEPSKPAAETECVNMQSVETALSTQQAPLLKVTGTGSTCEPRDNTDAEQACGADYVNLPSTRTLGQVLPTTEGFVPAPEQDLYVTAALLQEKLELFYSAFAPARASRVAVIVQDFIEHGGGDVNIQILNNELQNAYGKDLGDVDALLVHQHRSVHYVSFETSRFPGQARGLDQYATRTPSQNLQADPIQLQQFVCARAANASEMASTIASTSSAAQPAGMCTNPGMCKTICL